MQVENSKMIYRGSEELARVYRGDNVIVWEPYTDPYESEYLTFEVSGLSGVTSNYGELKFEHGGYTAYTVPVIDIEFSVNDGEWKSYLSATTEEKKIYVGDSVRFRGTNSAYTFDVYYDERLGISTYASYKLGIVNALYSISGNIMSLVYGDNFYRKRVLTAERAFQCLFSHETLEGIHNYPYLNGNCTTAEHLVLPTKLTVHCFDNMFSGDKALTTPPILKSRSLAGSCYECMFEDCSGLTTAPELPATTLVRACYNFMFHNCTSLTTAPVLNASVIPQMAYHSMFIGCTSLNYVKCLATNIQWITSTYEWLKNVSQTGTFVKDPNMSNWQTGDSGIPSGWTVVDAT